MLIDLIAPNNMVYYNVCIANRFGLQASVYLSILTEINSKAIKKAKLDEEGYFTVDRKYVTERSTLTKTEQKTIDKNLSSVKVISVKEGFENKLKVDSELLASLLMDDDESFVSDVRSTVGATKKADREAKRMYQLQSLKMNIRATDPELRHAYEEWVEVLFNEKSVNKKTISEAERIIDEATLCKDGRHNLDVAIAILNIASANAWKNVSYAVDRWRKENANNNSVHSDIGEKEIKFSGKEF